MVKVGIDAVEIVRFINWTGYSEKKLGRIFSNDEITYCLNNPAKSAERFAARFAAKEACYKVLSSLLPKLMPFMRLAPLCTISHGKAGEPLLYINWKKLDMPSYEAQVSITHTATTCIAIVIIETK